ncbi:tryptophan halogenase family protein [Roseateles sp. P5_D6]
MSQSFNRIVIVGGGTAGWMTAAAIATGLKGRSTVEVVESEEIGIIGVGEATFPSIRTYNRLIGIDEAEFLRATHGTYKLGIEFRDWRVQGERYFHTFGDFGEMQGPHALWGQYRRLADPALGGLGEQCLPTVMAMQGRFVPPDDEGRAPYKYAYHFDATLYAGFLRRLAFGRGARRTDGRIVGVTRRADGGVHSLRLADGREIEGDLFIDCSGFGSLLLGKTLEEPFVDFSRWLPVDSAWACPCERTGTALTPYTRATALEGGWAWRIPLQSRTGHGHVFSSRHIDANRARDQLLQQLDGKPLAEPRLLRFTTGHRERFWVHNVVALGLSSGFLEPLESTSIFLIQSGLGHLMGLLTSGQPISEGVVADYNARAVREFSRIRDFIILHYCLTARRDSALWRDMAAMELPETLAFKIDAWRRLGLLHLQGDEGFDEHSWLAIHAGMQHWPERTDPVLQEMPPDEARQALQQRRHAIAESVARLPSHEAFLGQGLARGGA